MNLQSKKRSWWSTFKNSHIKSHNLKKFYKSFNKEKIPKEFNQSLNFFINSKSYEWSSKFWRRLIINHLKLISEKSIKKSEDILGKEYFTFTHFNEALIKDACKVIENDYSDVKINLFKKQENFSYEESVNHNILIFLLYENIKKKDVFKKFVEIKKKFKLLSNQKPSLMINDLNISQDDLNSLFEFEKIEFLLKSVENKNNRFLEIGAGAGRTTQTILALKENIKYVVADVPPAINLSYNNIKKLFPKKKISFAYEAENKDQIMDMLEKNDILFIFPHQIEFLPKKYFDVSIAIDCLHEMEERIVKKYINNFEIVSKSFYFKVWELAGLPNSFYKHYSVHKKEDYFIEDRWREIFKEKCIFPSNYYQLGYKF